MTLFLAVVFDFVLLVLHWAKFSLKLHGFEEKIGPPRSSQTSVTEWLYVQNKDPYRSATYVGSFEVSVLAHVALRMLATIFLASQ
jgi:hypothetical protein